MDKLMYQPYVDMVKSHVDYLSSFAYKYLYKKKVIVPVTGVTLIYLVFLKRIGFRKNAPFVERKLSDDEEYDDEEHPPIEKFKSPVVSGWLFVTIYRRVVFSLFGKFLISILRQKFKTNIFDDVFLPDDPTFYPVVRGEKSLYNEQHVLENDLWRLLESSDDESGFQFKTISDLVIAYREKKTTPEDIAKHVIKSLRECKERKPSLNAFIDYYEDQIMKQAITSTQRWTDGEPLSLFDGVPIGIKDEYIVGGHHTRNGLPIKKYDKKRNINEEKGLVKRLRNGGAMIIGITNMHQIGMGVIGINQSKYHGTSRNPYNPNYSTSGSSGGSAAAVASGLCTFAVGSDGGGSIRLPSAACGIVGLKATYTRYSHAGMACNANTVGHTGALCSTIKDAALAYGFLAGKDDEFELGHSQPPVFLGDFENTDLTGFKIGVDWNWLDSCHPEIKEKCLEALGWLEKEHNAEIVTIHFPEKEEMYKAHLLTIMAEMGSTNRQLFEQHIDELNIDTQTSLAAARTFSAHDYIQAAKQRTRSINALKCIFKKVDVILTPGASQFQPKITESIVKYGYTNLSLTSDLVECHSLGNLTGIPCMCQPVGYSKENLPISVQLMSSWWREDLLFRVGNSIEQHVIFQKPEVYFDILK